MLGKRGGIGERTEGAALGIGSAYVWKGVERSLRGETGDAFHGIQPLDYVVAAAFELSHHHGDGALGPPQGLNPSLLGDRVRIRGRLALVIADGGDDLLGAHGIAEAPAGHGISLGKAV